MSALARDLGTSLLSGGLAFDDDHELFRESVRGFISRDVAPSYAHWRSAGAIPTEIPASPSSWSKNACTAACPDLACRSPSTTGCASHFCGDSAAKSNSSDGFPRLLAAATWPL